MASPHEPIYHPMHGMAGLPFSEAVSWNGLLFLSGQIGLDDRGALVAGGIGPETRRAMSNVRAALERHGSSLDRVLKVTVMLADMGEWALMNREYVSFFPRHLPARSAFGTAGLALGARVEIECVALAGAPT